jgi:hypothetical protein
MGQDYPDREAVAVFDSAETMQTAIDDLLDSGFDRAELSLLASEEAVEKKLGHLYRRVESLEDDPDTPRTMYVSPESIGDAEGALIGGPLYIAAGVAAGAVIFAGGPILAAVAGAAAAGGAAAFAGTVLARMLGRHHADYLHDQIEHGGLLLWVHLRDAEREKRAVDILSRHSGRDVHVHALDQRASAQEP